MGLSAHGAMACSWSTEWAESDHVELAMEPGSLRNLGAEEEARSSRGRPSEDCVLVVQHPCRNHNKVRVSRAPEHLCPNRNNVRVSRAYDYQSIHAQTIIMFVFREHTITRASLPKQ